MNKSTHFIGQPLLGQILSFIDHSEVHRISKEHGGEHYVKHFDGWHHLVTMLYAIIMRFDSLREIQASMAVESRKLSHLGLTKIPRSCTLSDANKRRPEEVFEPSISIHLSCYAELRAAIAFLSSEGILIANNQQVCIDNSNLIYIPSKQEKSFKIKARGTHSATWNIINGWISNNTKPSYVLEYFTYRGTSFKNIVQSIPYALNTDDGKAVFIKKWLKTWCFDIQKYGEDREGRNASSYNPNIRRHFNRNNLKDNLSILNEFWMLLEPSTDSFSKLDQYLFALYLKEVYTAARSNDISISKEVFILEFYQNSGLIEDAILTKIFINDEESSLIKHAKDQQIDPSTGEVPPLTIIARAILLLRFSCGSCSYLFKRNNIVKSDLDFYIDKIGQDHGIWDIENPTDLKKLWVDINDILIDFENYFKTNTPSSILNLKESFIEYSDKYTVFKGRALGLGIVV